METQPQQRHQQQGQDGQSSPESQRPARSAAGDEAGAADEEAPVQLPQSFLEEAVADSVASTAVGDAASYASDTTAADGDTAVAVGDAAGGYANDDAALADLETGTAATADADADADAGTAGVAGATDADAPAAVAVEERQRQASGRGDGGDDVGNDGAADQKAVEAEVAGTVPAGVVPRGVPNVVVTRAAAGRGGEETPLSPLSPPALGGWGMENGRQTITFSTAYERSSAMSALRSLETNPLSPKPAFVADDGSIFAYSQSKQRLEEMRRNGLLYTTVLMVAEQCGIGMLTFPSIFATFGVVPAVILTLFISMLAWQSGMLILRVKLNYPRMLNWHDASQSIFGLRWLRRLLVVFYVVQHLGMISSFTLSIAIAIANISDGEGCLVIYNFIGAAVPWLLSQKRFMHNASIMVWATFATIMIAIVVTIVGVIADAGGRSAPGVVATRAPGFFEATVAMIDIIFAYTTHTQFPAIISEMKDPKEFKRALTYTMALATALYLFVGGIGYGFVGPSVASPVLSSVASYPVRVVAYAFLILHVLGAEAVYYMTLNHMVVSELFGLEALFDWNTRGVLRYLLTSGAEMVICFLVVCVIPFFNEFVALQASITGIAFSYLFPDILYIGNVRNLKSWGTSFYAMWDNLDGRMRYFIAWLCVCLVLFTYAVITGVVSSVQQIIQGYTGSPATFGSPFSCDSGAYVVT